VEVAAFKAFRFDSEAVGDVGSCIAPPYDVISAAQQERLYEKSEYNIVRIIKGKTEPSDNGNNNQYTRAADYLNRWIEKGVLKQDSDEAIYAYVQDFELAGEQFRRFSFIALAKLEEFGQIVRPHEKTLEKPKIDRLNLQRTTSAKFGLVFVLYDDKEKTAEKIMEEAARGEAFVDFVDEQNVRHGLFSITDKAEIAAIASMMRDKSCIIADGHHRYETALNYAKESSNPAAGYQMLAFANTNQAGLIVLATHRLVGNLKNFDMEKLLAGLEGDFEIAEFKFDSAESKSNAKEKMLSQMKAEQQGDKNAFGIYSGGDGAFYTVVLKDKQVMDPVAVNMSSAWRALDVSVLHKLILEKLLGIDEGRLAKGDNIKYVKDTPNAIDESIGEADAGREQAAFFMNPPTTEQIQKVADEGEKMPQKSTYFYPKIYTGLTINKL
jgi:uncharacterized protein (DUF1015 family)